MSDMNWDLLNAPGMDALIESAASKVFKEYDAIELEDLVQEARIIVASKATTVEAYLRDDNLGGLHHWLWCDLTDLARVEKNRRDKEESFEARYEHDEADDEYAPRPRAMAIRTDTRLYARELVEALMPAIWDEAYCYGVRQENAPDADMPRGSINKATGNTLAAHIADIKTGWKDAPLTDKERRALVLGYGFDWPVKQIAYNQGVSHQVISERIANGVGKIVNTLNGVDDPAWFTEVDAEDVAA